MPLLERVLASQGLGWTALDALAVATGPGNFTGIRISVSAARGLALGLGKPAVGITILEAMSEADDGVFTLPGPRGMMYQQTLRDGAALGPATLVPGDAAAPDPTRVLPSLARLAARRLESGDISAPVPFYIKPADAAPASDPPPKMLA